MNKCLNCQNDTKNPKFCNRSCSASFNNKLNPKRRLKKVCRKCGKIAKSYRHTLCKEHWDEYLNSKPEAFKNRSISEYFNKESLKNLHTSSKSAHIRVLARNWFKDLIIKPCANCGYSKHVELCHIKPISQFTPSSTLGEVNSRNNIIQLCRNCHWELDYGDLKLENIKERL